MTAALHGNLRDFGMGEVFQLIGQQRKSGVLEVRGSRGHVELRFDRGRIVSAAPGGAYEQAALGDMLVRCGILTRERLSELEVQREPSLCSLSQLLIDRNILSASQIHEVEDLLTRDTIFDLLRWTDGSFRFDAQSVRHGRDTDSLLGAEQVLMDGLRMVDEWRTFAAQVPSESMVFRRVGNFEGYRRARKADPEPVAHEERMFLLIDGRLSARRVIDLSRLGTFDGMHVLARLRTARLIEPVETAGSPREGLHPARGDGRALGRPVVSGLLGLAALAAVAVAGYARIGLPGPAAGLPLPAASFAEARMRFELARARAVLEAFRFARGREPETVAELMQWSQATHVGLAASPAAPYYYSRSPRRAILLAPEY